MAQTPSSSTQSQTSNLSQKHDFSNKGNYVFSKAVLVSQTGGCRVLSYCEPLSCLLASQPSPHASLVPGECTQEPFQCCHKWSETQLTFPSLYLSFCVSGFGVKKMSTVNLKASHYVPIHIKQIRGLAFNRQQDGLMLSAAFDNTIKLTRYETHFLIPIGHMMLQIREVINDLVILGLSGYR